MAVFFFFLVQDTVGDKALRVVDGAIFVAKSAPLGTAVKVRIGCCMEMNASLTFVFGVATAEPGPTSCHARRSAQAVNPSLGLVQAGRSRWLEAVPWVETPGSPLLVLEASAYVLALVATGCFLARGHVPWPRALMDEG